MKEVTIEFKDGDKITFIATTEEISAIVDEIYAKHPNFTGFKIEEVEKRERIRK